MFSKNLFPAFLITISLIMLPSHKATAHCDTLDGPVVMAAQLALKTNDVTPVLKWVSVDDETMIKTAFDKTITVRKQSPEAKALADMYFFETLVRIHRASEGAPYSGLQPSNSTSPIIQLADQALESGSPEELQNALLHKLSNKLNKSFSATKKAHKNADSSVDAGRKYVKEYVEFTHFVEAVHQLLEDAHAVDVHSEH
ncbi:MAG TPA: DUF6448 family protein [Kangiella sp.]